MQNASGSDTIPAIQLFLETQQQMNNFRQLLGFSGFLILLTTVSVLSLFFPNTVNLPVMVLLPAVVFFFRAEPFEKIKLGTLIIGRLLITLTALSLFPGNILVIIVIWLLRINILEATVKDFMNRRWANGAAGVVQIITSFGFTGEWTGTYYITHETAAIFWIIAYTIWNWNFINLNFEPQIALYHVAVLAAPLIWVGITHVFQPPFTGNGAGVWLVMRGATLTFAVSTQILFKNRIRSFLQNETFGRMSHKAKGTGAQITLAGTIIVLSFITSALVWQI